jgi:hypothetical protein
MHPTPTKNARKRRMFGDVSNRRARYPAPRNPLRSRPHFAGFRNVIPVAYDAVRLARLLQPSRLDGNRRYHQPEQPQEP